MAIRLFVEQAATDQSRFFDGKSDALNGFVADVTTIVQPQCERATDYADIETLVSQFPIDHLRANPSLLRRLGFETLPN